MKKVLSMLLFCSALQVYAQVGIIDLETIRIHYDKAVSDKRLCAKMMDDLQTIKSQPVHLAYLGGFQTIWANHVFNPIAKLNTFKKGRANIDKAVSKNVNNLDVRLVRLSVQKNAPAYLNYNSNIQQDETFLKKHKWEIKSPALLNMVNALLK